MQEQLRKSLSEKELLLREVHHRVKNNLQVITSLLDLQSRTLSDPESIEKIRESQDRIRLMLFIHEQLYRTDGLEKVNLQSYIESLTTQIAQSHGDPARSIRIERRVDDLLLDVDRALACGLIINELVTNAYKQAFPDGTDGEIKVRLQMGEEGECELEVSDNGRGFSEAAASERTESLGLTLVSTFVTQLSGRMQNLCSEEGTVFRLKFPVELRVEAV